jgi:hypothetical protein
VSKPKPGFTGKELLDSLEAFMLRQGEEGVTSREMAEATGHGRDWVRQRLRALKKAGRLELAKGLRENIEGEWMPATVYRLKK